MPKQPSRRASRRNYKGPQSPRRWRQRGRRTERGGGGGGGGGSGSGHFCCTLRSLCQLKCTSDALLLLRPAGKFILTNKKKNERKYKSLLKQKERNLQRTQKKKNETKSERFAKKPRLQCPLIHWIKCRQIIKVYSFRWLPLILLIQIFVYKLLMF